MNLKISESYQFPFILLNNLKFVTRRKASKDSVVSTATHYRLDGPRSNPGGDEIFHTRPGRPWGPPSLPYNGKSVFPGHHAALEEVDCQRRIDSPPPFSAMVKERTELYLYSPLGLHGQF